MIEDKKIEQLTPFAEITATNSAAELALTFEDADYKCTIFQIAEFASQKSGATRMLTPLNYNYNEAERKLTISTQGAIALIYYKIDGITYSIPSPAEVQASEVAVDQRFDTFYVDDGGLKVRESTIGFIFDPQSIVLRAANHINIKSDIWQQDVNYVTLIDPRILRLSKALQQSQAANMPSANILVLPSAGNYVNLSDNINEIQLISSKDSDGNEIQGGTKYVIDCLDGTVFNHLFPSSGDGKKIRLDCKRNFTSPGNFYTIVYDENDEQWEMAGTATGDLLDQQPKDIYTALKADAWYSEVNTGSELFVNDLGAVGYLAGCTFLFDGTAEISINADENNFDVDTAGTIYNLMIFDSGGTLIHNFPFCEQGRDSVTEAFDSDAVDCFDIVTQLPNKLNDLTGIGNQSSVFSIHENGYAKINVKDNYLVDIPDPDFRTKIHDFTDDNALFVSGYTFCAIGTDIYLFFDDYCVKYDTVTNSVSASIDLTTLDANYTRAETSIVYNNTIYLASCPNSYIFKLDPNLSSMSAVNLAASYYLRSSAEYGGKIYFGSDNNTKKIIVLDTSDDSFVVLTPLYNNPHVVSVENGYIYFAHKSTSAFVGKLDVSDNSITYIAITRGGYARGVYYDGYIYWAPYYAGTINYTLLKLNVSTDAVTEIDLSTTNPNLGVYYGCCECGGKIFLAQGNAVSAGGANGYNAIYDPATDTVDYVYPLNTPDVIWGFFDCLAVNNQVYFCPFQSGGTGTQHGTMMWYPDTIFGDSVEYAEAGNNNFLKQGYSAIVLPQADASIEDVTSIVAGTYYTLDELITLSAASPAPNNQGHIELVYKDSDPTTNQIEKIEVNITNDLIKTLLTFE